MRMLDDGEIAEFAELDTEISELREANAALRRALEAADAFAAAWDALDALDKPGARRYHFGVEVRKRRAAFRSVRGEWNGETDGE